MRATVVGGLVAMALLGIAVTTAVWMELQRNTSHRGMMPTAMAAPDVAVSTDEISLMLPTIILPPVLPAEAAASYDPRARVIGVTIAGRHRAYVLSAFHDPSMAVVDDLIGNVPITIAHQASTGRTRVFSSQANGFPLEMAADTRHASLRLSLNGITYDFDSAEIPLSNRRFTETTWGEWRKLHPESDLYVGVQGEGAAFQSGALAVGLSLNLARNRL